MIVVLVAVAYAALRPPSETDAATSVPGANASASPTASASTDPSPMPGTPPPPPPANTAPDPAEAALTVLATIPLVDGRAGAPYERELFGQPWLDVDRNGCDTRNDILGRDLVDPVFKGDTNGCKVLSGLLIDPYDGTAVEFVSGWHTSVLVQIDHAVALGWAWQHGADAWTTERRTSFANDPLNLVAASQLMNQEKGAFGPSEWMPPVPALRCAYVEGFVSVLDAYDLGINEPDRAASEAVLRGC